MAEEALKGVYNEYDKIMSSHRNPYITMRHRCCISRSAVLRGLKVYTESAYMIQFTSKDLSEYACCRKMECPCVLSKCVDCNSANGKSSYTFCNKISFLAANVPKCCHDSPERLHG
jgi:hypothetical protein